MTQRGGELALEKLTAEDADLIHFAATHANSTKSVQHDEIVTKSLWNLCGSAAKLDGTKSSEG